MPRYIDADALMKRIYGDERPEIYDGAQEVDWIMKCLDEASTISPDEVRGAGKWIQLGYTDEAYGIVYKCAKCGCSEIGEPNYCPNCGAKMEVSEDA